MKVFVVFLMSLFIFSGSAFARKKNKSDTQSQQLGTFYPPAPDTPHIQFLTYISGSGFLKQRKGLQKLLHGNEPQRSITKPFGFFIRKGKMFICDPPNGGLDVIDLNNQKFSYFSPGGAGALNTPLNCFVDTANQVYVADPALRLVNIYDSNQNLLARLKDTGNFKPSDVVVYKDTIWVTNPANHTLNLYDLKTKEFITYFNTFNKYADGDPGFLYNSFSIYITEDKVYASDFGDFKIKVFDHTGKYLSSIGSYGTSLGQFARPKGIACDSSNILFAVDAGFENVQMFNDTGSLLMYFGGPFKKPNTGCMWLPAHVVVDYDNAKYFEKYVDPNFNLKYVIIVSNQYGPEKMSIYGAIEPKKGANLTKYTLHSEPQEPKAATQPVGDTKKIVPDEPKK